VAASDRGAADPAGKQTADASGLLTGAVVVPVDDSAVLLRASPVIPAPQSPGISAGALIFLSFTHKPRHD
jgi:hypothetical protein